MFGCELDSYQSMFYRDVVVCRLEILNILCNTHDRVDKNVLYVHGTFNSITRTLFVLLRDRCLGRFYISFVK